MQPKTFWIINHYASTPETGFGGRSYYLAKEMANIGHTVYVISAGYTHNLRKPPNLTQAFTTQRISANFHHVWVRVPIYRHAHDKKRVLNWFLFAWRIRNLTKVIPHVPHVVLISSAAPFPFLPAQRIAKRFKARLAFEVRDIWPLSLIELGGYSPKHPFIRFIQWLEDKAYQDADAVISNLPNAVEHMVSRGMRRDKFHWVANGVDAYAVANAMPLDTHIAAMLPENKFLVCYAGTFGFTNGLHTLMEAARHLQNHQDICFVLVGGGKEKDIIAERAKVLKNVILIDEIAKKQVQSILKKIDACYIGLEKKAIFKFGVSPNKLFDYFLSATPIIYAIESGDYLPVEEAKAGLSIPAESPEALVRAVLELKSMSQTSLDQMGRNGYDYVIKHHSYQHLAQKLTSVLS